MSHADPFAYREPIAIVVDAVNRALRGDDDLYRARARWIAIFRDLPQEPVVAGIIFALRSPGHLQPISDRRLE